MTTNKDKGLQGCDMEGYLDLLLEQVDKNQQINEFAKRERDAIAAGDIGIVMESDAMRREIIAQLQSVQSKMEPYLKALPHELEQLSPQLRDQMVTVCKQLDGIISETIAIDRENAIKLQELKEGVGEKIEEIRKGKKALTGYKNSPRKAPKLFDGAV
jgi:hypothetical protein